MNKWMITAICLSGTLLLGCSAKYSGHDFKFSGLKTPAKLDQRVTAFLSYCGPYIDEEDGVIPQSLGGEWERREPRDLDPPGEFVAYTKHLDGMEYELGFQNKPASLDGSINILFCFVKLSERGSAIDPSFFPDITVFNQLNIPNGNIFKIEGGSSGVWEITESLTIGAEARALDDFSNISFYSTKIIYNSEQ